MLLYKQKKNQAPKGKRLLVSVTVLGSAGPIRFVVDEGESVGSVIGTALKSYAREGRLPVLGSNLNEFFLYCPNVGSGALDPSEAIGSLGARNFMLCRKTLPVKDANNSSSSPTSMSPKGGGNWKTWIHKSFNRRISSH